MDSESALAVNVTFVVSTKVSVQSVPQFIPSGLLVTMPSPVPFRFTSNVYNSGTKRVILPEMLPPPSDPPTA